MSGFYLNFSFKYVIFYLQLTQYIYSTCSEFNNCRVPTVCQVTVHKENSKLPPPKSMNAWRPLITGYRTLSKVQGRLRMVWQAPTMHRWSASSFSLFVSTDKNIQDLRHTLLDRTSKTKCHERCGIARAERDGTRAETRFRLSPKLASPFKSVGASVKSTVGSRGVRISLSNNG